MLDETVLRNNCGAVFDRCGAVFDLYRGSPEAKSK